MKLREVTSRIASVQDKYSAFGHVQSVFMMLPGLTGLWTAGQLDPSGNWDDWHANDLTLSAQGTPLLDYDGLITYIALDGLVDYFNRADEAATSITGTETHIDATKRGITLGCWFITTDVTTHQYLVSKVSAAAGNYSYWLGFQGNVAGDPIQFAISDDGTNTDNVQSSNGVTVSQWTFAVGRFNDNDTGEELAVFLNGVKTTAATARASIFDGNAAFEVGSGQTGSDLLEGAMSIVFLCACSLSDDMIGALFQQTRAMYGI